jgi:hypothetical protein
VLGHSSVKVTERYAHLVSNAVQGVANAAQAAWETRHGAVVVFRYPQKGERYRRCARQQSNLQSAA